MKFQSVVKIFTLFIVVLGATAINFPGCGNDDDDGGGGGSGNNGGTSGETALQVECQVASSETGAGSVESTPINDASSLMAQSFQVTEDTLLGEISFYGWYDTFADDVTFEVRQDNGGDPDAGTLLYSGTFDLSVSTLGTSNASKAWADFDVSSSNVELSTGVTYWLIIKSPGGAWIYWTGRQTGDYTSGHESRYSSGTWTDDTVADKYFKINDC